MHEMYEIPKCTHAFILHQFPMITSLLSVSILYPFGPLMNFRVYTSNSYTFKPISHLTMGCYHQNPIRRTLGLTIFLFLMMTNLGYLGEKKNLLLKPIMDQFKRFLIGSNVKHENEHQIIKISYHIYMETKPHMYKQDRYEMTMTCMRVSQIL